VTTPLFERLAVVGLGLVGGSVALGARERGIAGEVRGVDPGLEKAGPIPLVSLAEAAAWADALVLAVPLDHLDSVFEGINPHLAEGAVITDVASVKQPVAEAARRWLDHPEQCVGAHPMAGGDATGFAHARADLFEGAACILALEGREPPAVVDRVDEFWQCFGTFTARRTPAEHDALCAALSHAPHAIAYAAARGLPGPEGLRLAGGGLRDFVRIARANPALWCEILLMNRTAVAEQLARFDKDLGTLREALALGDREALVEALRSGQKALERLER
jgi:cyclohexadieny/prephenate dehydrogenase